MSDSLWDRWDDVDRIFTQALGLAVEDRERFVEETCGDDAELFDTVNRLLRASEREDDFASGPGSELLRAAFTGPGGRGDARRALGLEVGPYRIVREVGRGGTATVYEAERVDGAFEQRVAVKMLDGVDSDDLVGRFLVERRILSSLSHPNIAGILDGGATDDGRPYLVMDFVEGETITRWADRNRLTVHERLELFRQVAHAVAYAHARLVVHRDLKPSNVLVDEEGRVKLLDFGIAKLLDVAEGDSPLTRPATRWMTPEYAAPEQVLGHAVTTATDVHGLGVLLYQLLAGRRPFGGEDSTTGFELSRAICEEVPRPASVAAVAPVPAKGDPEGEPTAGGEIAATRSTTPARLRTLLAGDLDAILDKALRKDPEERYRSAQEMGDDVDLYLEGRPVAAREGLWGYRARKFVGRYRLAVGTAAAIAATVLVAAGLLVREQAETARERDRAEAAARDAAREAENGRLVIGFLADVFRGRDPTQAPADTLTARGLLDWGTERVDTEFTDRPEVRAELLLVLGDAHGNMGLYEEGQRLHQRAVDVRRGLFGPESVGVAEALVRLGAAYRFERNFEAAVPPLEEAVGILRATDEADEGRLADALEALALVYRDTGLADSSEVLLHEALALRERRPDDELALVTTTLDLAYVLRGLDRLDEAQRLYEEGIPRYRALPDHEPATLATNLNNLAYLLRLREEYPAAEALYREALEVGQEAWGRGHPTASNFAGNLASVLILQGRLDEAVDVYEDGVDAARSHWTGRHWRIGSALTNLANALIMNGELERADSMARAAVDEYTETLGAGHDWTSFAAGRVAIVSLLQGDTASGRAILDRLHARMVEARSEAGGSPTRAAVNLLHPFVTLLDMAGLDAERARFEALRDSVPSPGGQTGR